MRVFLDSRVLLSASGSEKSPSRLVAELSMDRGWHLVSAIDCQAETNRNISKLGPEAAATWPELRRKIEWVPNALSTPRPLLLPASKDKPVLTSALAASCDVLLTLDKGDFGILLGTTVYGMKVCTPREFLRAEGLG